jgi:hypothetical protein
VRGQLQHVGEVGVKVKEANAQLQLMPPVHVGNLTVDETPYYLLLENQQKFNIAQIRRFHPMPSQQQMTN